MSGPLQHLEPTSIQEGGTVSEVCEVCGREKASGRLRNLWANDGFLRGADAAEAKGKCFGDDEHWRLGYEREKARASEARALALREAAEIVERLAGKSAFREWADRIRALGTNPPADWAPLPGVTEAMDELRAELARCSDQPAPSSIPSDRDPTGGAE